MVTVIAKKKFNYDGADIDKGEFFDLRNKRNDEKLVGLRYCEVAKESQIKKGFTCDCGKVFATQAELNAHRELRHRR